MAFSRIPLYICQIPDSNNRTIGEGGSWSRIPAPFSRQSRIPTISHLYPEYRFLSQQYTASRATILANPDSPKAVRSHIPSRNLRYTFYRIPCYILVNSRIPRVLFKTLFSCLLFVRKFDCFQSVTQAARKKKKIRVLRPPAAPSTSTGIIMTSIEESLHDLSLQGKCFLLYRRTVWTGDFVL